MWLQRTWSFVVHVYRFLLLKINIVLLFRLAMFSYILLPHVENLLIIHDNCSCLCPFHAWVSYSWPSVFLYFSHSSIFFSIFYVTHGCSNFLTLYSNGSRNISFTFSILYRPQLHRSLSRFLFLFWLLLAIKFSRFHLGHLIVLRMFFNLYRMLADNMWSESMSAPSYFLHIVAKFVFKQNLVDLVLVDFP